MQMPPPIQDWMTLAPGFAPAAGGLAGLRRLPRFKRWIYLLFSGSDHQIGLAWVDLGYVSKVFVHYSPDQGQALSRELLLVGPRQQLRRHGQEWQIQAAGQGLSLSLRRLAGQGLLALSAPGIGLTARWEATATPLLWSDTPQPHHTHKACALPARWRLSLDGTSREAEGLLGADLSYGEPPRHIEWYWAFAQQPGFGFNLVEGFTGASECGYYHAGSWHPLSEGSFQRPSTPEGDWIITTRDEALDLRFSPVSAYTDRTRLGLVRADFIQAYGRYRGRLRHRDGSLLELDLPGVAEYQDSLW